MQRFTNHALTCTFLAPADGGILELCDAPLISRAHFADLVSPHLRNAASKSSAREQTSCSCLLSCKL
eukprot:1779950-Rhodomonas_salina.3